jgi:hypothetical protein
MHSIYKKLGFTDEFVARYAYDHQSGESFKATIFDTATGNPFRSCYGVYALDFAYGIANDIGADCTEAHKKMGRGFQAGCLVTAISHRLEELEEADFIMKQIDKNG